MPKTTDTLTTIVTSYPRSIVILSIILSLLATFYTIQNMTFLTGRDDLMPRDAAFQVDYRAYHADFGDQEEIVAVLEADDPVLNMRAATALYMALEGEKGLFRDLFFPGGLSFFRDNALMFMPLEETKNLANSLIMAAPTLKDLAAAPSVQTLFNSLTGQIDSYLESKNREEATRLIFMIDMLDRGFKGFGDKSSSLSINSFLAGGGRDKPTALEQSGKLLVITLKPVKSEGSFVASERSIIAAKAALKAVLARPEFKGVTGGLTGVPVLEYEEMSSGKQDMSLATALSLVLTVILLLFAFRGIINVIAAMIALLVAISISFAFATLAVGHLNILSMVFAVMLVGLGIEYGIQLVLRYQEERMGGVVAVKALQKSLTANYLSISMAGATTSLAFITFVFTDFKGIAELGIIAAGGIAVCVLTTFTLLPALLILLEPLRKPAVTTTASAIKTRTDALSIIYKHPKYIITATLLFSLACLHPVISADFDFNLMNLQARGLQSVEYAYKLMRNQENSGYFAAVTAADWNEARRLTTLLEKLPSVDHVVSPLSFVPENQKEKLAEIARIRTAMNGIKPASYSEDLQVMALPAVFENFRNRVLLLKNELDRQSGPDSVKIAGFIGTLDGFFATLEGQKDKNALGLLREFQGAMFAELPEKLALLQHLSGAKPISEKDVPEALTKRFTGADGKLLLQVAPKKEIFNREPLSEFVNQVKSVAPKATGEPVMVYESLSILRDAYLKAFIFAFAGIVALLLLCFRNLIYALLGTLPLAVGLLLMVGGMKVAGISFNSANIIVLPLLLGVGIDSAIYILNRYRNGVETPFEVVASSAGKGVFLNALTILFSFGALMVASHQGVFSIGAVMSIGMVASVAAFLLFLPALLAVWGKR